MAEQIILKHVASSPTFSAVILRYFNVIGSDPLGRIGESPRFPDEATKAASVASFLIDAVKEFVVLLIYRMLTLTTNTTAGQRKDFSRLL